MEKYLTATEARRQFLTLVDETQSGDQIVVTKRGKPAAVLIDFERLQTLRAVAGLLQNPEAMRAMRVANEDSKAGRVLRLKRMIPMRELLEKARKRGLLRG